MEALLTDILKQDYTKEKFEVIIINDSSSDNTIPILNRFCKEHTNFHFESLKKNQIGKKEAIHLGLNIAKGSLIITTDGDCRMYDKWLSTFVAFYEAFKPHMIIGPVAFYKEKNIFEKIQSLEFLSLIGTGAGSAGISHPILCNGANLAYEKEACIKFKNLLNMDYASGDDVFLLHNLKKEHSKNILFLKSAEAIVYPKLKSNLYELIQQRIRWVSKSTGFKDTDSIITAMVVWLMSSSLLTVLVLSFFYPFFLKWFLFLFILKSLSDFVLLWNTTAFFNKKNLLFWFLPLQMGYFFYVSLIGIFGCFVKSKWKGRKI